MKKFAIVTYLAAQVSARYNFDTRFTLNEGDTPAEVVYNGWTKPIKGNNQFPLGVRYVNLNLETQVKNGDEYVILEFKNCY